MCNCNDNINSVTVYTGPAGPTGPQGPAGNDSILTGTSTSNLAATTGTKTIVTQANISWVPGMRLRVSDGAPATPRIMEGEVSTYTGTTLVLNVDYTEGPASLWNNWVIGVSGAVVLLVQQVLLVQLVQQALILLIYYRMLYSFQVQHIH